MSSSLSSAPRATANSTSARRFSTMSAMQTPAAILSRNMRRGSASYGGPSSRQPTTSHSSGASPSSMPPADLDSELTSILTASDIRFADQEFILQQQSSHSKRNSKVLHKVVRHQASTEQEEDPSSITYSQRYSSNLQEHEEMEYSSHATNSGARRSTFSEKSPDGQH
jgi:hypothetical protein